MTVEKAHTRPKDEDNPSISRNPLQPQPQRTATLEAQSAIHHSLWTAGFSSPSSRPGDGLDSHTMNADPPQSQENTHLFQARARPTWLIDAITAQGRTKPMQLLCMGHLRTGTISLDTALRELGYKTYHGKALMDIEQTKRDLPLWLEALRYEHRSSIAGLDGVNEADASVRYGCAEFDKIIGEYNVLLEPAPLLYSSILAAYPSSKIILTTRSTSSWLASMRQSIFPVASLPWSTVVDVDPDFATPWWYYVRFVLRMLCGDAWVENLTPLDGTIDVLHVLKTYEGASEETEKRAVEAYEKHYVDLRKLCKENGRSMLEWEPSQGWTSLCEYLGVTPPLDDDKRTKAFPRSNDKEEFLSFHAQFFEGLRAKKNGLGKRTVSID